jgi:putative PIN family toxin of toxin-antitoxin system
VRVFLDTNVLISAFATRGLCADVLHTVLAEHQLVLGETVLSELARVQRLKFGSPDDLVQETLAFLRREATVTSESTNTTLVLRDPTDLKIVGEALATDAEVLVTGDRDLLDAAAQAPLPILSPRAFWDWLRSES